MSGGRSPAPATVVDVEVRYAETDQMGVVHHSRYLVWFELVRTRHCEATGIHYADIEAMGYFLVVTRAELSFRRGARYGETPRVSCRTTRLGSRGMSFEYEVKRGDEVLVTGATEHVWVERATGRPCRMPEAVRPGFQKLAP